MALSKKPLAEVKSVSGGDPTSERARRLKQNWNEFHAYLVKKGVAGSPALDTGIGENNLGIKYIRQYQKENPNTLISPETVKEVQSHFQNYRQSMLDKIKAGKIDYTGDKALVDTNFMKELSVVDGIPGRFTTSHSFPSDFLNTVYISPSKSIEKITTENKGLSQ